MHAAVRGRQSEKKKSMKYYFKAQLMCLGIQLLYDSSGKNKLLDRIHFINKALVSRSSVFYSFFLQILIVPPWCF